MPGYAKGVGLTFRRWVPTLVLIAVVAALSGPAFSFVNTGHALDQIEQQLGLTLSASTSDLIHIVVRKGAHFILYGSLFLVLSRGPLRNRPMLAVAACIAVAALDEFHQSFLPERSASFYDVMLDTSGALFSRFAYGAWFEPW